MQHVLPKPYMQELDAKFDASWLAKMKAEADVRRVKMAVESANTLEERVGFFVPVVSYRGACRGRNPDRASEVLGPSSPSAFKDPPPFRHISSSSSVVSGAMALKISLEIS